MDEPIGRREANKLATRTALQDAARALFAEYGYEATTVREIAARAGVGERTFYRYFEDKESLLGGEFDDLLERLRVGIRAQPLAKAPLAAVRDAAIELTGEAGEGARQFPGWFLSEGPHPYELLRRSASRPLLRFEEAIADGLLHRGNEPGAVPVSRARAELAARVSVAVIRTIAIRRRELVRARSALDPPQDMLRQAFAELAALAEGDA